jgi:hypothetical protein
MAHSTTPARGSPLPASTKRSHAPSAIPRCGKEWRARRRRKAPFRGSGAG